MPEQQKPTPVNFKIDAQYIKDLSFEGPAEPKDLMGTINPRINVNVSAQSRPLERTLFEVTLESNVHATVGDKTTFKIELAYAGIVTLPPGLPEGLARYILFVEVPRHLFPFARNIVANATRDGGLPPFVLQPIDFNALYADQLKPAQQAAPAAAVPAEEKPSGAAAKPAAKEPAKDTSKDKGGKKPPKKKG